MKACRDRAPVMDNKTLLKALNNGQRERESVCVCVCARRMQILLDPPQLVQ